MKQRTFVSISILLVLIALIVFTISARGCPKRGRDKIGSSIPEWSLPAPSGLTAQPVSTTQIDLQWQDNSNNEDGFEIERRTLDTQYSLLATVGAGTASYPDPGPFLPFTTYYYRLRAFNTIGDYSDYSNEASAITVRSEWRAIAAGESHSLAINTDGSLWVWGDNQSGQLGLGDASPLTVTNPTLLGQDTDWFAIAAGYNHTLVLKTDRTLWSWGLNEDGELGLGDWDDRTEPAQVGSDSDWSMVAGGGNHSLGIKTTGTLWSWGYNSFGQLGIGGTLTWDQNINGGYGGYVIDPQHQYRLTPTQIGTASDWDIVATGSAYTLAIKTNRTLWSWGWNEAGQLGDNTGDFRITPRQIGTDSDWLAVSAGYIHTIALKTTGTLWGWGYTPTKIGTDTDWTQITAGGTVEGILVPIVSYHSLALKTNSTLCAWGKNNYGQLGLGDYVERSTPTQIGAFSDWVAVAAGGYHIMGLKSDGTLWLWGRNQYGQLGLRDTLNRNIPCPLGSLSPPSSLIVTPTSSFQIDLSWIDNAYSESGFKIERRYDGSGAYIQIDTVGPDVTLYSDTTVTPGNTYYYQVRAYNDLGDSPASNEVAGISFVVAPSSLNATASSSSQVDLVWTDVNGKSDYKIERKIEAGGSYQQIATVSDIHLYFDTPLTPSTIYYYRVRAYNAGGDSAYSPEASAATPDGPPGAPALLIVYVISPTQIDLVWTDISGEIGYKIERSFGAPGAYVEISTVNANVLSYSDTTVTPSNTYYYRVRAYNLSGDGPYSTGIIPLRPLSGDPPPTGGFGIETAGYRFSSDVNGQITALGRYIGSGTGNTTVILWNDTGTELGRVTVSSNTGWQWEYLATPVYITADTFYRVSVSCTTVWSGEFDFTPPSAKRGNITISDMCFFDPGLLDIFPDLLDNIEMRGWADIAFVAE